MFSSVVVPWVTHTVAPSNSKALEIPRLLLTMNPCPS